MRLGWVCPISSRTGVGSYAQSVLAALSRLSGMEVVVLHPPCPTADRLPMPCPTLPLSEDLIPSDLPQLFDLMLYHLGNNDTHHGMILRLLMAHPGPVVLHDHVYQHMLAGIGHDGTAPGPGFGALIHASGGAEAFDYLAAGGVLRADGGQVAYVPWESGWASDLPLSDLLASLGCGTVVHSDFAASALKTTPQGEVETLFMPRPDDPVPPPISPPLPGARLRLAVTGHIGPTKGIDRLITALSSDPALAARYAVTIAGHASDARYLGTLQDSIAARQLSSAVRLVLNPDDKAFRAVMQEADLFLNLRAPNTEGASLSLAEQMASGRPVIVRDSGCFAEMPRNTGWHLPIGDSAPALTDVLHEIAETPKQIATRGTAAARYMGPRNAQAYAEALSRFLQRTAPKMRRRAAGVCARARHPARADRDWQERYATARGQLAAHLNGTLLWPPGLWNGTATGIGRYVALNLLDVRLDPDQETRLGETLRQAGPVVACARIGALRQLSARAAGLGGDVPHYLSDLYLPCGDPTLWQILLCLPPARAVPQALQALGQQAGSEAQARVSEAADRSDIGAALCTWLDGRGDPVLEAPAMASVRQLLRGTAADLTGLTPVTPGADLVALALEGTPTALRFEGFHPPEASGIWTAEPVATLWACPPPDTSVTVLTGAGALLDAALREDGQNVQVRAVEEQTGRSETWQDHRPAGGDPGLGWTMPLPGFCGPVRIEFTLPACHSPRGLGASDDPRPLGLMLQSLRLETGPRLVAA